MITDIFARRYEEVELRTQYFQEDSRFLNQAVSMVGNSLWSGFEADKITDATEAGLKSVHDALALELGRQTLSDQWWWRTHTWNGNTTRTPHKNSYAVMVKNFLIRVPEDVTQGDIWVKERLSLIELAFRYRAALVQLENDALPKKLVEAEARDRRPGSGLRVPGRAVDGVRAMNERMNAAFDSAVSELNERMRLAKYKLHYHNGFIQLSDDELIDAEIGKPFWTAVNDAQFQNVDLQIKEAIDRRDRSDRTAAFHAVCALESCIKIISDIKGWTTGKEKGASNYIDNLVSKKNNRFIEPWEAEMLRAMFSDVRNPFAHGPGQAPMPKLTDEQTQWAIDTSMTWCRTLLSRLR